MWRQVTMLCGAGLLAMPVFAQPNIREGEWATVVKMEMENMPIEMPPFESRQCLTNRQLVPQTGKPGEECKIKNRKIAGKKVSWEAVCAGPEGRTTGKGLITYERERYHGDIHMEMEREGQVSRLKYELSGKRIGPCPKAAKPANKKPL